MISAAAMLIALGLDLMIGWPKGIFERVGHPVTWMGRLISVTDKWLNRDQAPSAARHRNGVLALCTLLLIWVLPAWGLVLLLHDGWALVFVVGVLSWPLIAARSMAEHVVAVHTPLVDGNLLHARAEVAMIVGRDVSALDEAGVARATLESLAENTSDGIVAPIFWGAVLGLPGIVAYKAINTADSMIGHRTPRHAAFGWAAARLDDLVNWIPARLTALIFAMVSGRPGRVLRSVWQNAHHHRSPNAGWPEAAMAAALDVRLSGPRIYAGLQTEEPWINAGGADPVAGDILGGLRLFRRCILAVAGILGLLVILTLV